MVARFLIAVSPLLVLGMPAALRAEPAAPAPLTLTVKVTGIKSAKGVIRLALCPAQARFPDCGPQVVRSAALPIAAGAAEAVLSGLAPGAYAVSLFHDANGNGRLDTFAGIPREGYGFSRNPPFRPRAPRFDEAVVQVNESGSITIRLRYLL